MRRGVTFCAVLFTLTWLPPMFGGQPSAFGFDPFSAVSVVGAGADALGSLTNAAGEVAATADSLSDLYSEVDSDTKLDQDAVRFSQEAREVKSLAQDVGYSQSEIADLTHGDDPESLSQAIQGMTRAVRAGKRVGRLAMRLDQKAKVAQLEQAATSREQLLASYEQIRLAREAQLGAVRERLLAEKEKKDQISALENEEKALGGKVFGHSGVLSFPRAQPVMEEALKMAESLRGPLLGLLLFVLLVRVVYAQFSFGCTRQYGELLKDALLCALLLMIFPELVRACVTLTAELSAHVGLKEAQDISPHLPEWHSSNGLTLYSRLWIEWAFELAKFATFAAAQFLSNFGLAFLILIFPLIIFGSQMLGFTIAWPIFLGGFLSICLWPLLWNATGSLALILFHKQEAGIADHLSMLLFGLLQFLSPLITMACLKGGPMPKVAQAAAKQVVRTVGGGVGATAHQGAGVALGAVGIEGGGALGRLLAYPVNQTASRAISAGRHLMKNKDQEGVVGEAAKRFVLNTDELPKEGGVIPLARAAAEGFQFKRLVPRKSKNSGGRAGSRRVGETASAASEERWDAGGTRV